MIRLLRWFSVLIFLPLALSGCSGGGDSGGARSARPTLTITTDNAGTVADEAFEAQQGLGGTSDFLSRIPAPAAASSGAGQSLLALVNRLADRHVLSRGRVSALVEQDCTDGGIVDITQTEGGASGPEGDRVTLDYTGCIEDDLTFNGMIVLVLTELQGELGDTENDWSMVITFNFDSMSITDEEGTFTVNGELAFGTSYDASAMATTISISSNGLNVNGDGGGLDTAGDFSYSVTITESGSLEFSFEFTAEVEGGRVVVEATGLAQDVGGYIGQIRIRGANDTSIVLDFSGGGAVTVAVDTDEDSEFECIQDLTLDTLDQFDPANC